MPSTARTITVNDLTGTDVTKVAIDLAAALNGTTADGRDTVIVNATNADDAVTVATDNGISR